MFDGAHPVAMRGVLRGAPLDGPALLALGPDRLRLVPNGGAAPLELAYAELGGVDVGGTDGETRVGLHTTAGDVVQLTGDRALRGVAAQLERRATALPELTRALRAVGTRRGMPGAEHDRFFGALLEARARAQQAEVWSVQLAAFGAPGLRQVLQASLDDFAASRFPASPPDRRALAAELGELAEALLAHLDRMDAAASQVQAAAPAVRLVAWRAWMTELRTLFEVADCCWLALIPALEAAGEPPPPLPSGGWRRLLGRRPSALLAAPALATLAAAVARPGALA